MEKWKLVIFLCLFVVLVYADKNIINSESDLEGPNVCKKIITENVTIVVTEMVPYQETTMEWCAAFPPRCKKTVLKLKQVNRTEISEKTQAIRECCDGFVENEQKNRCIPYCQQYCGNHGSCISPNVCKCDSGYGGPSCDISCPPGKYGKYCKKKCDCANGVECDPYDGSCVFENGTIPLNNLCSAGWTGEFCNEPCSDDFWGINCRYVCTCQNKSKCRKYDGRCLCESGYTGEFCDQKCPSGFYGSDCTETCNCSNLQNFQCHHVYGCICAEGFTGLSCEELNVQN